MNRTETEWRSQALNRTDTERRGGAKKRRTNEREMTRIEWKRMSTAEPVKYRDGDDWGELTRIARKCNGYAMLERKRKG